MIKTSQKLPIWSTLKMAYQFFFKNWKSFTRIALPWCILSTLFVSLAEYMALATPVFASTLQGTLINFGFQFTRGCLDFFIIVPMLSILFIQCVVLKNSFPEKIFYFSFKKTERTYILYSVLFFILVGLIMVSFLIIGFLLQIFIQSFPWGIWLGIILGVAVLLLLGARIRLTFSAVACGDNSTVLKTIRGSWKAMKGSTLRLVVLTILGTLPIVLILLLNFIPLILSATFALIGKEALFDPSVFTGVSMVFTFLGTLIFWIVFYGVTNCIYGQVYIFKRQEMLSFLKESSKKTLPS